MVFGALSFLLSLFHGQETERSPSEPWVFHFVLEGQVSVWLEFSSQRYVAFSYTRSACHLLDL